MPEHGDLAESHCDTKSFDVFDVTIERVFLRVSSLVGLSAAERVEVDHAVRAPQSREERVEVVVRHPWAAGDQEDRRARALALDPEPCSIHGDVLPGRML